MSKILSVSVAAYNLGGMIDECLNSFVNSKAIDKVEIIVTDDGSKDDTPLRVQKYVDLYPDSVKLIKQPNAGPGSTVNSGIAHATGKYFRMVDGDDWVNTEIFTEFVNYLENCDDDAVFSDYDIFDDTAKKVIETKTRALVVKKTLDINDCYKDLFYEMHATTFKTAIFKDNGIVLDNGFYTDMEYLLLAMQYVKTVSYFDKSVYVYRIARAGQSVSAASMIKNNAQHVKVLERLADTFECNGTGYSFGVENYIAKRIADIADVQLKVLLISGDKKTQVPKIKRFIKELKMKRPKIYAYFKTAKKVKLLTYSNYLLYSYVKKKVEREF